MIIIAINIIQSQMMCLFPFTNRFYFSFRKDLRSLMSFFPNLPFTQIIIATVPV